MVERQNNMPIQQPFPVNDSNNVTSCQLVQKQLSFEPENFHSFRKLSRVFCHVYSFLKLLRTKEKPEIVFTAAAIQSL